jgi:hypothetical protein
MSTSTYIDYSTSDDQIVKTKQYFDNYQKTLVSYPSNQVDAVIGFFTSRGFELSSAQSVAGVLLQQAKVDQVNVMELIDKIKNFDKVRLNDLVAAILNANRDRRTIVGFKDNTVNEKNIYRRNIIY